LQEIFVHLRKQVYEERPVNRLKQLYCNNNQLEELPELPSSLEVLYCGVNQLEELPELP